MGRRRRAGRDLQKVLTQAVRTGYEEGVGRALQASIEARALDLLDDDYRDAENIFRDQGFNRAPPVLEREANTTWRDRWQRGMRNLLSRVFEEVTRPAEGVLGIRFTLENPTMSIYFEDYIANLAGGVSDTTKERVTSIIRQAAQEQLSVLEAATRIREHANEISSSRAQLIAVTELHAAKNGGAWLQALESGVVNTKTWNATGGHVGDGRTREEHKLLHSQTRPIAEEFSNGLAFPREPRCRCWLTFGVDREALR